MRSILSWSLWPLGVAGFLVSILYFTDSERPTVNIDRGEPHGRCLGRDSDGVGIRAPLSGGLEASRRSGYLAGHWPLCFVWPDWRSRRAADVSRGVRSAPGAAYADRSLAYFQPRSATGAAGHGVGRWFGVLAAPPVVQIACAMGAFMPFTTCRCVSICSKAGRHHALLLLS